MVFKRIFYGGLEPQCYTSLVFERKIVLYFAGFFEDLVTEAKIDADKPVIMQNTIHARKTIARRAKTKRFQRNKSSSEFSYVLIYVKYLRSH